MAWCHEATSPYLRQCWPRSLSPYGVTIPRWVKSRYNMKFKQKHWRGVMTCQFMKDDLKDHAPFTVACSKIPLVLWGCNPQKNIAKQSVTSLVIVHVMSMSSDFKHHKLFVTLWATIQIQNLYCIYSLQPQGVLPTLEFPLPLTSLTQLPPFVQSLHLPHQPQSWLPQPPDPPLPSHPQLEEKPQGLHLRKIVSQTSSYTLLYGQTQWVSARKT